MNKRNIEAIYPLSPAQEGMLYGTVGSNNQNLFVEQICYKLSGAMDTEIFSTAWSMLVKRHAILRTGFVYKTVSKPLQFVLKNINASIDFHTFDEDRMKLYCKDAIERGFNLEKAPLIKVALVKPDKPGYYLIVTMHHILMDGWCTMILLQEWLDCYHQLKTGKAWNVTPARAYKDYIAWINSKPIDEAVTFWKKRMNGIDRGTELGTIKEIVDENITDYAESVYLIGRQRKIKLDKILTQSGLTWNTLTQAAFSLLLAQYHGSNQVVFGTTVTDRPDSLSGIENTLGLFINTLPFSIQVPKEGAVIAWLKQVQASHVELREYAYCAAGQIHSWCQWPANHPLFNAILVFENYPGGDKGKTSNPDEQLVLTDFKGDGGRTAATLTLLVAAGDEDLQIKAVYQCPDLDADSVELIYKGILQVMDAFIEVLYPLTSSQYEHINNLDIAAVWPLLRDIPVPTIRRKQKYDRLSIQSYGPKSSIEEQLCLIWSEILGLEEISIEGSFFELGGHSLLATQLLEATRQSIGLKLTLVDLFQNPTIKKLAVLVEQRLSKTSAAQLQNADDDSTASSEVGLVGELPLLVQEEENRYKPFPLTDIQQAYWVGRSNLFQMGNVATHSYMEMEAEDVNEEQFHKSLNALIERHDMLRMVVDDEGKGRILEHVPEYKVVVHDTRGLLDEQREQVLNNIRLEMSHKVLPADTWPLFALQATRLSDTRYRLHLSMDMLIVDGSSHHILFYDFLMHYHGRQNELSNLELRFRDYACFLESLKSTAPYNAAKGYWLKQLENLPFAPELTLACDPQSLGSPVFIRRKKLINKTDWRKLRHLCKKNNITESALLCSVYAEVLRSWSKNDDFCINLTLFNRLPVHTQVNEIVGDFTSTLLLAARAHGRRFIDRCHLLQEQLWSDIDNSMFSGVEVLRELNRRVGGTMAMPVVFTSGLVFDDGEDKGESTPFLSADEDDSFSIGQTSQVWLDLQVLTVDGALQIYLDAVEDLFPKGMIDDMFSAFQSILSTLINDTESVGQEYFDLLPDEQFKKRVSINNTQKTFPIDLLHEPFLKQEGYAPAILTEDDVWSINELKSAIYKLSAYLQRQGVERNRPVAVLSEKGWQQVVTVFAISLAGGTYVPLDATMPKARIENLVEQTQAQWILCSQAMAPMLEEMKSEIGIVYVTREELDKLEMSEPVSKATLDSMAYIIFTSGSTGTPKGVVIQHQSAINTILDINHRFHITANDRALALSALNFDLSVYDIFGLLAVGGALVIPSSEKQRDPTHWYQLIMMHKVSIINAVPALVQILVDYLEVNALKWPDSIRLVMMSGDWIPVSLPHRIRKLAADNASNIQLISLGGATEASIWSIYYPIGQVASSWKSIPYGKPLANQTYHVLHPDFSDCPDYVPGNLYIGGAGLAMEYWRDSEKTANSFVKHPKTGVRLYRTGDMGRYMADGNIEFLGREDTQVKIQGHRIELGEVEAQLIKHPNLSEVVVTATGETTKRRLVAYYVSDKTEENRIDMMDLTGFLKQTLPGYMVPELYVALDKLPLTKNGKVDRKKLPEPDFLNDKVSQQGSSIVDADEKRISKIWSELLGVLPEYRENNFFDDGGNSVSLVQLSTRLRAEYSVDISLRALFERPTLAGISAVLKEALVSQAGNSVGISYDKSQKAFLSTVRRRRGEYWLSQLSDEDITKMLEAINRPLEEALSPNKEDKEFIL